MPEFISWLRVELLRLRGFDWGSGYKRIHQLKDGVMKFTSIYETRSLAHRVGISEEELIGIIDSPSVKNELEGKSFTLSWNGDAILLSWLEEGISECKTEIFQDYYEEDGQYYAKFRWVERIVYLDGTERIVSDTGEPKPVSIPEEDFKVALEQIRRNPSKQ